MIAAAIFGASMAIVAQDHLALRNAPRDSAARQAVLWQGDVLEVRAERMGYLQVWDPRRERAGWVLASMVRTTTLQPQDAPALLAVLRFLSDAPGSEALGIAYAAAYLKAAPAAAIDAEPFDALGTMAERLARLASQRQGNEAVSAHLEVAASYGVRFASYDHDGTMQLCYDGDAFRRVLALPGTSTMRARAALALTRPDCIDPALPALERQQRDLWRADVLDRLDVSSFATLGAVDKNRLDMRRAGVWSAIAFQRARKGDDAAPAGQRAIDALAAIDQSALTDDDAIEYTDAAMRVGASRWAVQAPQLLPTAGLRLTRRSAEAGQTCVQLKDGPQNAGRVLVERCTFGVAWLASASASADGAALALAVQPLEGWRELWVFRRGASSWSVEVLPPSSADPALGYAEFAGWVPGGHKMLIVREARGEGGRQRRSFEVLSLDTLGIDKQASSASLLVLFGKWQDPAWKRATVSIR